MMSIDFLLKFFLINFNDYVAEFEMLITLQQGWGRLQRHDYDYDYNYDDNYQE